MALEVEKLTKEIRFKGKGGKTTTLPYPDGMNPSEAVAFHSKQHPELTTAKVEGPKVEGGKAIYTVSPSVGTKG